MLFSMDYQWTSGGPQPGVQYTWVVETGNGKRLTGAANLSKREGTIQGVLHGVRPDQGPFKATVFVQNSSPGLAPEQLGDFIPLAN